MHSNRFKTANDKSLGSSMIDERILSSPFDPLLLDITGRLRASSSCSASDTESLSFFVQQLGLLRMHGAGEAVMTRMGSMKSGQGEISFETMTLEFPRPSMTVFLGYNALVNTLCQLDRALPQHVASSGQIPLRDRVRFYRNKVAEHWDEYTSNIVRSGMTFKKNAAPIPVVEGAVLNTERQALLSQLKHAFGAIGAVLTWPDEKSYCGVSIEAEYGEAIFTAFEGIREGLTSITFGRGGTVFTVTGSGPELFEIRTVRPWWISATRM